MGTFHTQNEFSLAKQFRKSIIGEQVPWQMEINVSVKSWVNVIIYMNGMNGCDNNIYYAFLGGDIEGGFNVELI